MALQYLIFEYSDDENGNATWDAMASVNSLHWPALLSEVQQVLHWAFNTYFGMFAPLDEGGDWDFALSAQSDTDGHELPIEWDISNNCLKAQTPTANSFTTLTLTLSGTAVFGQALHHAFELSEDSISLKNH